MRQIVVDSSAAIAFLRGEEGGAVVASGLLDVEAECWMHSINACEVYYDTWRFSGPITAGEVLSDLETAGVRISFETNRSLIQTAGEIKVSHRLSLADAFALAFKRQMVGEILTADRHEFEAIQAAGESGIVFIR